MGEREDVPVDDFWAFLNLPDALTGDLEAAYRNGDPLRTIAAARGEDIAELAVAMTAILGQSDELERCRSVRRRSVTTAIELRANEGLVDRLSEQGVARTDIPTILRALGSKVDIEMANELLGIPGGPLDLPADPRRGTDKLSLLFVAGMQHRIEPDYKLALGKMSLDAVAALRDLLRPEVPYQRLADILGIIEATARAIQARKITALAYQEYEDTALRITGELGMITKNSADPWPVPAGRLRNRYGRGYWEDALALVGLVLPVDETRFGRDDYFQALDDFTEESLEADFPMDIGTYDRWVVADSAMGADRPSAIDIVRHYGSWELAMTTILPLDQQEETEPVQGGPTYLDYDSGWGTLEELNEWEAREFEEWRVVQNLVDEAIAALPPGSFLHIQYSHTAAPFARATPGSIGVTCEIVSELSIPSHEWRMSTYWLSNNGWSAPSPENTNWIKEGVPRTEAAAQILLAIQRGRHPVESTELRWNVRTHA